jgi:predicted nucleic acid-binding Zn ribbon protein
MDNEEKCEGFIREFNRDVRNAHIFFYVIAIVFVMAFILKFV